MHNKKYTLTLLFILSFSTFFGQDKSIQKDYYNWFDDQVGIENTNLFNGLRYKEKYRTIEGNHKFFISSEYKKGNIKYDGQMFFDVAMKYDIHEDQIIINLPSKEGQNILQLIDKKVESFTISDVQFIRVFDKKTPTSNITGFYKTLYQSQNLTTYKKYKKIAKKNIKSDFVYYNFKEEIGYYIYFNEEFYLIDSKNDLLKLFPNYKKQIKEYYKTNSSMISYNFDEFIIQLSEQINNNISSSNK